MTTFQLDFKRNLRYTLVFVVSCGLILFMFMAIFPSMKDSAMQELVNIKLDALPSSLLAAFGISSIPDFTKASEYFAYIYQYFILAAAIFSTIIGCNALGKEESNKTLEYLYAQPLSRSRYYLEKLLSSIALVLLFTLLLFAFSMLSIYVFAGNTDLQNMLPDLFFIHGMLLLVMMTFVSIGYLLNSFLFNTTLTPIITFGILFLGYFSGILSRLNADYQSFVYLSFVDYATPSEILKNGIDPIYLLVCGTLIIMNLGLGYFLLLKKDFRL